MKTFINSMIGFMAVVALIFCTTIDTNAQQPFKNGEKVTVKGEVLDMNCYMTDDSNVGEEHAQCAKMCVSSGLTMGLLDADGNVYLMVENHNSADAYNDLRNYGAEQVSVSGIFYHRGGVNGVIVQEIDPETGR